MKWRGIDELTWMPRGRTRMRASAPCSVFEVMADGTEVLVAHFEGEIRAAITGEAVRVETDGTFQFLDPCVNQIAHKTTNEVFTSLDRPSPLSPEMLAVQQMMRRNEIERDLMRQQMEKFRDETRAQAVEAAAIRTEASAPLAEGTVPQTGDGLTDGKEKPAKHKRRADNPSSEVPENDVPDDT